LLASQMRELLHDSASPLLPLLDKKKTEQFLESPSDYGRPWYGQLMAGPQLIAYLLQIDFWMREYQVELLL
ncbi:MAG: asparagine synthetase B, partial [Clostridium sp.]